jgi:N-methylhydantoinase A/oxoprolinase/acetone carboxylase beta subunit
MIMSERLLGVDIGGTFTDFVSIDPSTGTWRVGKRLTSDDDPARSFLQGVAEVLGEEGLGLGALRKLVHGTTLVTNLIIERRGVSTGLITTTGFRDAIELGREFRYDVYDLQLENPEPLVPRPHRLEVAERMSAEGEVLRPLNLDDLRERAEELIADGVQSVAVCLLHSYKNPVHEQQARDFLAATFPELSVSISSEVAPEIREYERTSTVTLNAYVKPVTRQYLLRLEDQLHERGLEAPFYVMLSSGGITTASQAADFPIRIIESGPAAGAIVARHIGERAGLKDVIGLDMGGTTAKIALVEDGQIATSSEFECGRVRRFKKGSGLPVKAPVVELLEIGAGGGSIAAVNELGLLQVGPRSSGAMPGPACYGQGGTEATVTDADLLLGYLDSEYFLGGAMNLDLPAARAAFENLGADLSVSMIEAARGVRRVIDEQMATAMQMHIAERGGDPTKFAIVATGGAGPVHACSLARPLGIGEVIIPIGSGAASALGLLVAPIIAERIRSMYCVLAGAPWAAVGSILDALEEVVRDQVRKAGGNPDQIEVQRSADMRYVGQGHEIRVPLPGGRLGPESVPEIERSYAAVYEQLYGHATEGVPIEVLSWRVTAMAEPELPDLRHTATLEAPSAGLAPRRTRPVFFAEGGEFISTPVYDRYGLQPGDQLAGPAIVEERESTAVVPPGASARVDGSFNLRIQLNPGADGDGNRQTGRAAP